MPLHALYDPRRPRELVTEPKDGSSQPHMLNGAHSWIGCSKNLPPRGSIL
jgi:hypothetical protein